MPDQRGRLSDAAVQVPAPTTRHAHSGDRQGGTALVGVQVREAAIDGSALTNSNWQGGAIEDAAWLGTGTMLVQANKFFVTDQTDTSKQFRFQSNLISTGTIRTVILPNVSGTMGLYLKGTAAWDPASLTTGSSDVKMVTVTGAAVGDPVSVGFSQNLGFLMLTAYVSVADTVNVTLYNPTDLGLGTVDLASGTLTVLVWKA